MTENSVLTVLVENKSCMAALGAIIGEHLFDPRLYPQKNLVVCAYGVEDCGKSIFLNAARAAISINPKPPAYEQQIGIDFVHKDFGKDTYPLETRRSRVLGDKTALDYINGDSTKTILHLFEHAPIVILQKSDVGIVISWPGQEARVDCGGKPIWNNYYLTSMSCDIDWWGGNDSKEGRVTRLIDQLRAARQDTTDHPLRRIVRVFRTSNNFRIEKALENTRKRVMNEPTLSVINP